MHIAAFLETRKITVEETYAYRLQSALFLQENYI